MENTSENAENSITGQLPQADPDIPVKGGGSKKGKREKFGKGAEALLRVSLRNHMDLSDMADRKANLLITVNTLAMSLVGPVLYTKLGENPGIIVPTILLVASSLAVIILAIISTRPKISKGLFTSKQVENKAVNLLFFGNFHRMSLKDFQWATKEMLHDPEYMYDAITQDIYSLGKVVAKKYRFLRLAYSVFMYGLIISVIAFGVTLLYSNSIL